MDFKLATCPSCNTQHLLTYITVGITCKCGKHLYDNDSETKKEVEKQVNEDAFFISTPDGQRNDENFKKFVEQKERIMAEYHFIPFKVVSIPNETILKIINNGGVTS